MQAKQLMRARRIVSIIPKCVRLPRQSPSDPCHSTLGVRGHWITVNLYYLLSYSGFPLLQAATEKMKRRPAEIAQGVLASLGYNKDPGGAMYKTSIHRVLRVGVRFKRGQGTLSNSLGLAPVRALGVSTTIEVVWADKLGTSVSHAEYLPLETCTMDQKRTPGLEYNHCGLLTTGNGIKCHGGALKRQV